MKGFDAHNRISWHIFSSGHLYTSRVATSPMAPDVQRPAPTPSRSIGGFLLRGICLFSMGFPSRPHGGAATGGGFPSHIDRPDQPTETIRPTYRTEAANSSQPGHLFSGAYAFEPPIGQIVASRSCALRVILLLLLAKPLPDTIGQDVAQYLSGQIINLTLYKIIYNQYLKIHIQNRLIHMLIPSSMKSTSTYNPKPISKPDTFTSIPSNISSLTAMPWSSNLRAAFVIPLTTSQLPGYTVILISETQNETSHLVS